MTILTVAELTQTTLDGTGVFDTLMRANKAHLEAEFNKGRIKGTEYATVYLGSLETVMRSSMEFLLQKQRIGLEAELLAQQILLAQVEVIKANAAVDLVRAQIANAQAELAIIQANALKVPAEIALLEAQTALVNQQMIKETSNNFIHPTDVKLSGANDQQRQVLVGQKCKLDAEFDLLQNEKLKSAAETTLLAQKNATEKAQVLALGVDDNSVVGRQKALYEAQTVGFQRDAEQKATKILLDNWAVKRTTNEAEVSIVADPTYQTAVSKLIAGIS